MTSESSSNGRNKMRICDRSELRGLIILFVHHEWFQSGIWGFLVLSLNQLLPPRYSFLFISEFGKSSEDLMSMGIFVF